MAPRPVFLHHPSSLQHDTGGHPERIERIVAVLAELERRDWLGYEQMLSEPVARPVLELVHPAEFVDGLERAAAAGGGQLDPDTVSSSGSFVAAMHACGGAVELVDVLLAGGPGAVGFSAHRPPGHHALPSRAMGFCLFNAVAVAARYAVAERGVERVLVLDWDVHHGNGTNDIFWEDPSVLFASIHQWPLYPGSGRVDELGAGSGLGYTINLPVPSGSGDEVFVSLVRDLCVPVARSFSPELVLVSAGFDAHRDDPLATCTVTEAGFAAMTALVRDLGLELGVPVGCVLEGGYSLSALASSVAVTMEVLAGGDASGAADLSGLADLGVTREAVEARARLTEYWPALASPL